MEPSALSTSTRSPGASRPVPAKTWTPAFSSGGDVTRLCLRERLDQGVHPHQVDADLGVVEHDTQLSRLGRLGHHLSRGDERLARHTVGEDRGSAQPVPVDDGDLGAQLCRDKRRLVAARPASEDRDPCHATYCPASATSSPRYRRAGDRGTDGGRSGGRHPDRRAHRIERHDTALVLGSGWAGALDMLGETVAEVPQNKVPGFPPPAVEGQVGIIRSIRIGTTDRMALFVGSRTHLYEGKGVRQVVHGVRTAAAAGCRAIVLTNGCGGLREVGPRHAGSHQRPHQPHRDLSLEGPTFVDLTDLYAMRLREIARQVDPSLAEGVYVQFPGPQYETPAEVRMARAFGGDLVGMSTTLEAIAAREAGMEVLGISLVTNLAAGISKALATPR